MANRKVMTAKGIETAANATMELIAASPTPIRIAMPYAPMTNEIKLKRMFRVNSDFFFMLAITFMDKVKQVGK